MGKYIIYILAWTVPFVSIIMTSCSAIEKFYVKHDIPDDNFVEEIIEAVAENKLGLPDDTLDFSPDSPE